VTIKSAKERFLDPERLAEVAEEMKRLPIDYAERLDLWAKRSAELAGRFVALHQIVEWLDRWHVPSDVVQAELLQSARCGEFGFIADQVRVRDLFYLFVPAVANRFALQELEQLSDDEMLSDARLHLSALEIEHRRCILSMWGEPPALARWLRARGWPVPPWVEEAPPELGEYLDKPHGPTSQPAAKQPRVYKSERPNIQGAARKLGKGQGDFKNFEEYRRALCKVAGVNDVARGWGEDNVRQALKAMTAEPA
jgi:hypothetical protein